MSWSFSSAHTDFPAFAPAWDALNQRLFDAHPLLDSAFIAPLIELYGPDTLRLARETVDGQLRSAALVRPLAPGAWRVFALGPIQMTPALMAPEADWDGLLRSLPGMALLLNVNLQDPQYSHLAPCPPVRRAFDHACTIGIALEGGFERYWQGRSRHLRQNLGRYQRRLREDGQTVEWRQYTEPDAIVAAVDRYSVLESAGWKGRNGTALHPGNLQGAFFRRVMQSFAHRASARVSELWIDGRLAASRLAIGTPAILVMLKTTYDEELARYAPGMLLLRRVIEGEFAAGQHRRIEFYTNATPAQHAWATDSRWIRHFEVYRNQLSARVIDGVRLSRAHPRAVLGGTAAVAALAAFSTLLG